MPKGGRGVSRDRRSGRLTPPVIPDPPVALKATTRQCGLCLRERPIGEFVRDASKPDGFSRRCLECDRLKSKLYYEQNRERVKTRNRNNARLRRASQCGTSLPKTCSRCGEARTPSARHRYCVTCGPLVRALSRRGRGGLGSRPRGKTSQRGYGTEHQKIRKQWTPLVARGGVDCARCGQPIIPGETWDLGHDDHDRSKYTGPEHPRCNRATAGRSRVTATSRQW